MKKSSVKKTVVISLGGSLIIPDRVDFKFLDTLKKTLRKHCSSMRFVLVCGGGSIARRYISALEAEHRSELELAEAGIRATRMNALFVMQFFGREANKTIPLNMKSVLHKLAKNKVVVCGALRFAPHSTSDTTAAQLAHLLKAEFINLTNVKGLYSDDPKKNPKARFISHESWRAFESRANKIKYHNGQHFVLDQQAATLIRKHSIPTYILGKNLNNLNRVLHGKSFVGTRIDGSRTRA